MTNAKSKTRHAIVEAAFAVFSERPTASLGEVAKRAGVGRATLHRHFPGRSELISALSLIAMEELNSAVDAATADAQSATQALFQSLQAIVPLANRQWFLAQDWLDTDAETLAAYEASREELRDLVEGAKSERSFAADIPTEWIIETVENLIYAAWSTVRTGTASPAQATDLAWRTLTVGLKEKDL